jgi:hypothetical protein
LWDHVTAANTGNYKVEVIEDNRIVNTDGEWKNLNSGDGIGFSWDLNTTRDINSFDGLCLVYNLIDTEDSLKVGLAWADSYGEGVFYKKLPAGSHAVNIPWSEFEKDFGATRKTIALGQSAGLIFKTDGTLALAQLGKLGACTAPVPSETFNHSPVQNPNTQMSAPPEFALEAVEAAEDNKISAVAPVALANSLRMQPAQGGINAFSQKSGAKLVVYSINGSVAMQVSNLNAGENFVSLSNLKQGAYIARLQNGSEVQTIRINR